MSEQQKSPEPQRAVTFADVCGGAMKPVKDNLPTVALLEVDGGKWKLDTVIAIGEWLETNLPAGTKVIA